MHVCSRIKASACSPRLFGRLPREREARGLQPTSLIGRDQDLIELTAALTRTRLLTLTAVGGVGKTRLALAIAEHVAGLIQMAWFVELAR
jgi:ATP/maltotriose-dependent transcriptional regulator MalT